MSSGVCRTFSGVIWCRPHIQWCHLVYATHSVVSSGVCHTFSHVIWCMPHIQWCHLVYATHSVVSSGVCHTFSDVIWCMPHIQWCHLVYATHSVESSGVCYTFSGVIWCMPHIQWCHLVYATHSVVSSNMEQPSVTCHIMFISDVIQTLSQDWAVPEIVRLSLSSANAPRHFLFFLFCFWLCYVPSKSVLIYVTLIIFVIIIIIWCMPHIQWCHLVYATHSVVSSGVCHTFSDVIWCMPHIQWCHLV